MPGFNPNVTRVYSGHDLDDIQQALWKKVQAEAIVDPTQVLLVLDDEMLPAKLPQQDRVITIRLPSLIWAHGDVMTGGGNLCEFIVQGQTRITLWLRNELDILGSVNYLAGEALAAPPRGQRLIGRLIKLLWEDDLLDAAGEAITKRPLMFVSYEPPGPGPGPWRAFRTTWEVEFTWDPTIEKPE